MRFSKWHALGNTYLLIEPGDGPVTSAVARALCDPAGGLEADGVVEIVRADVERATITIWNPDGSVAEMSGNGARIAARWLTDRTGAHAVSIDTGTRVVRARMLADGLVETDLGGVEVAPEERVSVGSDTVALTAVSVGNPHAVVRVEDLDTQRLRTLGPALETHERFPERTNVQLVQVDGLHDVSARVWERGVGETTASGSSAAAIAAVSVARGWCESPVTVHFPGGSLVVRIAEGRAMLVGPAVHVSTDEYEAAPDHSVDGS